MVEVRFTISYYVKYKTRLIDLLQISLVNDGKTELGVVFGYRLVSAAPIEHKLFLDFNNDELLN